MKHCKRGIMSIVENWGNTIKKKRKVEKNQALFHKDNHSWQF